MGHRHSGIIANGAPVVTTSELFGPDRPKYGIMQLLSSEDDSPSLDAIGGEHVRTAVADAIGGEHARIHYLSPRRCAAMRSDAFADAGRL